MADSQTFTGSATGADYDTARELALTAARERIVATFGEGYIEGFTEETTKVLGETPPLINQVTITISAFPPEPPEPDTSATTETTQTSEPGPTKPDSPTTTPDSTNLGSNVGTDAGKDYGVDYANPPEPPKVTSNTKVSDDSAAKPKVDPVKAATSAFEGLPGRRTFNPLGDFSSYTYQISLYIINPDSFNTYSSGGKTIPKDFQLVAQSGGINNDSTVSNNKRAPGFENDFYIDNLNITTAISGKETRFAGNSYEFTFNIFEPYGFTFPTKLVEAARAVQANSKIKRSITDQVVALQSQFMLTIRFYGYDKNGKLVTGKDYPQADVNRSDSQCVFERSFPVQIYHFDFKLDKMVTYNIKAKMVSEQIALGTMRGTVKGQQTITASTVGEALAGGVAGVKGLVDLLNEQQDEWLQPDKDGKQKIGVKDVFKIEFQKNSGIDTASIGGDLTVKAPLVYVANSGESTVAKAESASAATVNKELRTISIKDGMPIPQVIDQIITQSDFIGNAMLAQELEDVQQVKNTDKSYDKNKPSVLSWYNICPQVTKILEFDTIRKTFACEITYVIQKYEIPYVRSTSHGYTAAYYGPHKRYDYWYTGNNKEILSYEQNYNLLFFNAGAASSAAGTQNTGDNAPNSPTSSTDSDATGRMSGWFEQVNGLKTFLYSPADQLNARVEILGDPDYLMPAVGQGVTTALQKWYGPDFSINPNSGQVFIEINFRQGSDYKNKDGLLEVSKDGDILFWDYPPELKTKIKGVAYMLVSIVSKFSKGKFTQELKTKVPPFSGTKKTATTATTASAPTVAATDGRENTAPATTSPSNATSDTSARTGVNLTNTSAGGGRGVYNPAATTVDDDAGKGYVVDTTGQGSPEAEGRPRGGM